MESHLEVAVRCSGTARGFYAFLLRVSGRVSEKRALTCRPGGFSTALHEIARFAGDQTWREDREGDPVAVPSAGLHVPPGRWGGQACWGRLRSLTPRRGKPPAVLPGTCPGLVVRRPRPWVFSCSFSNFPRSTGEDPRLRNLSLRESVGGVSG